MIQVILKVGVNVLVFSSEYNGMFFDEKTSDIDSIHHGVRTVQVVRLDCKTPLNNGILFQNSPAGKLTKKIRALK